METFSKLLVICVGNSPGTGEFPAQRPVTWSFDVFFDLHLNKRLSKQTWGWWFETLLRPLWRHNYAPVPSPILHGAWQLALTVWSQLSAHTLATRASIHPCIEWTVTGSDCWHSVLVWAVYGWRLEIKELSGNLYHLPGKWERIASAVSCDGNGLIIPRSMDLSMHRMIGLLELELYLNNLLFIGNIALSFIIWSWNEAINAPATHGKFYQ